MLSLLLVTCGLALSTAEPPLSECTADSDCSGGKSRCCKKPSMGQPHPRGVCYDPSDSTCCTDGDPNSGEFHVCGSGTTCCQALSSRCCNAGENANRTRAEALRASQRAWCLRRVRWIPASMFDLAATL